MRRHRAGGGSAARGGSQRSIVREFEASRPARPSPLTASAIRDMPLDLVDRIRSFPLFASAPEGFLAAVGAHLKPTLYAPQENILTEGDEAKAMYWLVRGGVMVTSRDRESTYAELKPGAFFGEIGILMDIPRTASIIARYKTLAVRLNKDDLRKILPDYPEVEQAIREEAAERLTMLQRKKTETKVTAPAQSLKIGAKIGKRTHDYVEGGDVEMSDFALLHDGEAPAFKKRKSPSPSLVEAAASSALSSGGLNIRHLLKGLPLFSSLPNDILHYIGLNAQPKSYPPFTDIIRQDAIGREIFFITDGEVEVYTETPDQQGPPDVKARLKFGQYFGEVTSLSLYPKRSASVRSVDSVECLVISGEVQDVLWQRCSPEIREQIEATARRRLEETKGRDIEMQDASGVTPDFVDLSITTRTPNANLSANVPSSRHKSAASSFEPFDPDPFSDADRVPKRPREGRRGSVANIPSDTSPLADSDRSSSPSPNTSPSSSKPSTAPASPTHRPAIPSRHQRPRFVHRPASQLGKGVLPDSLLIAIFQHLDVFQLMRLRTVSVHWSRLLSSSNDLLECLDLRPYNRLVTDFALSNHICPFVGPRPRVINISNCFHISDEGFNALASHCGANVEVWKMKSVWDISAQAVVSMANKARNLEEIDFSNCRKVSDNLLGRVIGWIQRSGSQIHSQGRNNSNGSNNSNQPPQIPDGTIVGCPSLSRLTLSYCKHISDQSMAHIARHAASRLEEINFTRCTTITDLGFRHWSESSFPRLRKLVLADCTYLSDNAIVYLTHAAKGLQELDLSFCCALSDTAVEVLSLNLSSLTHLNLAFCGSAVSDHSMRSISLHLRKLRYVSVRGCVRATGVGVEAIVQGCNELELFDISQCKNLSGWLDSGGIERWDERGVRFDIVADGKWRVGE